MKHARYKLKIWRYKNKKGCSFGLTPKAQNHFLLFLSGWWCNGNVGSTNSFYYFFLGWW